MADLLVVASPTSSPLSTAGPVPTDGQPVWWRCKECGHREREDRNGGIVTHTSWCTRLAPTIVADGPFPFTVAVWQEVTRCPRHDMPDCSPLLNACSWRGGGGAVVATVEVTYPSHHADECRTPEKPFLDARRSDFYCGPDAKPDCWHTPTGTITRLDTPIPMDRPPADRDDEMTARTHYWAIHGGLAPTGLLTEPASWWWADIDIETAASGG